MWSEGTSDGQAAGSKVDDAAEGFSVGSGSLVEGLTSNMADFDEESAEEGTGAEAGEGGETAAAATGGC